jgi:hypothetical protein
MRERSGTLLTAWPWFVAVRDVQGALPMRGRATVHLLAVLPVVAAASFAACSSGEDGGAAPSETDAGCGPDVATPLDAAGDALDAADARGPGSLTVSLDATLDADDGDVKASAITTAELHDKTGAKVASAKIVDGKAVFGLAGVTTKDDLFVMINGDADDLVPTRIDDPSDDVLQRVGTKLRASRIGPPDAPRYRINTYPGGGEDGGDATHVVKYSDGTPIADEHPYIIVSLAQPKIEIRLLGTAATLSSLVPNGTHTDEPFDAWLFNTDGFLHHGDAFNAQDGGAPMCSSCHANMGVKPAGYDAVSLVSGSCFHCHYGTDGDGAGFVDPTR